MIVNQVKIRLKCDLNGYKSGSLITANLVNGCLTLPAVSECEMYQVFPYAKVDLIE